MDKFFGFRLGYILIALFVLRATLLGDNIPLAVTFGSLVLFQLPFVFEYASMLPGSTSGKRVKEIGFWFSTMTFFVSVASMFYGLFSKNSGVTENKTVHILALPVPLEYVWGACGVWLILGLADWIVYSSEEEKEFREDLRKRERDKQSNIPFEERVDHYKRRKEG